MVNYSQTLMRIKPTENCIDEVCEETEDELIQNDNEVKRPSRGSMPEILRIQQQNSLIKAFKY